MMFASLTHDGTTTFFYYFWFSFYYPVSEQSHIHSAKCGPTLEKQAKKRCCNITTKLYFFLLLFVVQKQLQETKKNFFFFCLSRVVWIWALFSLLLRLVDGWMAGWLAHTLTGWLTDWLVHHRHHRYFFFPQNHTFFPQKKHTNTHTCIYRKIHTHTNAEAISTRRDRK